MLQKFLKLNSMEMKNPPYLGGLNLYVMNSSLRTVKFYPEIIWTINQLLNDL